MATHYVLCPCCGRNHCSESVLRETGLDSTRSEISIGQEECRICRIACAYRSSELRDLGKNPNSDCRFSTPARPSHYHRCIPGHGDAVDFNLPVHPWNCTGHSHCKHGTLGVVEEKAVTLLRNACDVYVNTISDCKCKIHRSRCHTDLRL